MAVIMIDVKGLLEGKRLRKLGLKARLYYPLLLGLANTFARLELDYDLLAARFITFHDHDTANIADWFEEYEQAKLVFIYNGHDAGAEEPTRWAQFDTPVEFRRLFATKEDNNSPEPPEPAYTDWLKSIHGAEWKQFHLSNYQKERQSDISGKRAAAGRRGAAVTNAKRWGTDSEGQQNQQTGFADSTNRQSRLGVVLDGDEDEDEGEDVDEGVTSIFNLKSESESVTTPESSLINSGTGKTKTEAPVKGNANGDIPAPRNDKDSAADLDLDGCAEGHARAWRSLMPHNEKFDAAKLPPDWDKVWKMWVTDMRKLLDVHPPETVEELMAYSQSDSQRQYNFTCQGFINNCDRNLKFVENLKKTSRWTPVWERYIAIVTNDNLAHEDDVEFLDEQPKVNVEDEDDELV